MKFSMLVRIATHSGSPFGSNTTHLRFASNVCSMNNVIRRTGTYHHCWNASLPDTSVRAPNTTVPNPGNALRQLMPRGLSTPCLGSVMLPLGTTPVVFRTVVSIPAGAFHTPRLTSSLAYIPATYPLGAISTCADVRALIDKRYGK